MTRIAVIEDLALDNTLHHWGAIVRACLARIAGVMAAARTDGLLAATADAGINRSNGKE